MENIGRIFLIEIIEQNGKYAVNIHDSLIGGFPTYQEAKIFAENRAKEIGEGARIVDANDNPYRPAWSRQPGLDELWATLTSTAIGGTD